MHRDDLTKNALNALLRVQEHLNNDEPQQALELLDEICAHPRSRQSLHLKWVRAVVLDHLQCFGESLALLCEVIDADPLCVPFNHSLDVVLHRARAALREASMNRPGDRRVWDLYRLLQAHGGAQTEDHCAVARYWLSKHDGAKALDVLKAVTLLEPTNTLAWLLTAEAAMLVGDARLEQKARSEAASCDRFADVTAAYTMRKAEA